MSISDEVRKVGYARTIQYVAQLVFLLIIPILFKPENYGILSFVTTSALTFTTASSFGLNIVLYRYIPQFKAVKEEQKVRGIIHQCWKLRVIALIPFIFFWFVFLSLFALSIPIIAGGAAIFLGMAISDLLFSIVYGTGGSGWFAGQEATRLALRVPFLIIGFSLSGIIGAIFSLVIVELFIITLGLTLVRKTIRGPKEEVPIREKIINASQFWINGVFFTIYTSLGVYFIRIFYVSYTLVGYYSLGMGFSQYVTITLRSLGIAVFPSLVELQTRGESNQITELIRQLAGYLAMIGPLIIFWLFFLIDPIISIIAPSYSPSVIIVQIALFAALPFGIAEIFRRMIVARDKPQIALTGRVISFLVFIPIALTLSPQLNILSVVVGFVLGRIFESIYLVIMAARRFALSWPSKTLLIAIPTILLFSLVQIIFIPKDVFSILVSLVVFSLFYVAILLLTKVSTVQDIKKIIHTILPIFRSQKQKTADT